MLIKLIHDIRQEPRVTKTAVGARHLRQACHWLDMLHLRAYNPKEAPGNTPMIPTDAYMAWPYGVAL